MKNAEWRMQSGLEAVTNEHSGAYAGGRRIVRPKNGPFQIECCRAGMAALAGYGISE